VVTRIRLTTHGRFLTGPIRNDLYKFLDETKKEVADSGEDLVKRRLGQVLKHPTGYYQSRIHVEKIGRYNDQLITDGGVVYGPWLETGKYSPPRRFKGYKTFRRTTQQLRKWWPDVAQRKLDKVIARWNA
jgi:hypothetical protein